MKRWFILFFLGFQTSLHAQINIDSLRTALSKEKTDSITVLQNLQKIETIYVDEPEPLLVICDWALEQAKKLKNKYLEAYVYMSKGFSYLYTENAGGEPAEQFTNALRIAEPAMYYDICAQTYNGLATVYRMGRQTEKYEEYTLKSIEASKKINLEVGVSHGYANLASSFFEKDKNNPAIVQQAIDYQREANTTAEKMKDSGSLIIYYLNFSNYLSQAGKFDSAALYQERSKKIIDALQSGNDNMSYYYNKGTLSYRMGNYEKALSEYLIAADYAAKYKSASYASRVNQALYKTYQKTGNFSKALYYLELVKAYQDSTLTRDNFAKAADIQNKYQQEKKDKELLLKDLQLKTAADKKARLNILFIASLAILGLLAVFAIVLLKNIKARKRAYTLLEEKSIKIQEQAVELSKQARLIAKFQSQMNPHFVFNALHNIQGLVISHENEKATSQIQSLAQLMRKTFANAEKDDIPLEEEISYLHKYIDFEKTAFDNKLDFDVKTGKDVEHVLIPPMMIQPFVENAIKHAELKKVENPYIKVLIDIENNLLSISVKDNGIGLKNGNANADMLSHSMSVIRARIQLLFQEKTKPVNENLFVVKSVPDIESGTLVKFYLPLNYSY